MMTIVRLRNCEINKTEQDGERSIASRGKTRERMGCRRLEEYMYRFHPPCIFSGPITTMKAPMASMMMLVEGLTRNVTVLRIRDGR